MMANEKVEKQLEAARKLLLDLSLRNRLINTPFGKGKSRNVEIVGRSAEDVFRVLVVDRNVVRLAPLDDGDEKGRSSVGTQTLFDVDGSSQSEPLRSRDSCSDLPTLLAVDVLQKRLLAMYYDAREIEEEQGVNTLYIALGFLKWFESPTSDEEKFAPLLLVPVTLDRQSVGARFQIRFSEEDISTNLSLQKKLENDFGLNLPDVPENDALSPDHYFDLVRDQMGLPPRWEIQGERILLWFFSFSKARMYEDLDPDSWPDAADLVGHRIIDALLGTGFREAPRLCDDGEPLDPKIQTIDLVHVRDADSSQAIVIEEVRQGFQCDPPHDLVIQGPPGTGKSQTITNIIAAAVKEGKTVLFLAEKKAALEVVKRYLDEVDLGAICLELHARKATKKAVLNELDRTQKAAKPPPAIVQPVAASLAAARGRLNEHAIVFHRSLEPCGQSAFQIVGELVRLRADGILGADFELRDPLRWTADEIHERVRLLERVDVHLQKVGNPRQHPWRGVMAEAILPMDLDNLKAELPRLTQDLRALAADGEDLDRVLDAGGIRTLSDMDELCRTAEWLMRAPQLDPMALADSVWSECRQQISEILTIGADFQTQQTFLHSLLNDGAWFADVEPIRRELARHGQSMFRWLIRPYRDACTNLRGLLRNSMPKALDERIAILDGLLRLQALKWELDVRTTNEEIGRRAFGVLWQGSASDWEALRAIDAWETLVREAALTRDFRRLARFSSDAPTLATAVETVRYKMSSIWPALRKMVDSLALDLPIAFGVAQFTALPLSDAISRLDEWRRCTESITDWTAFNIQLSRLADQGLGELAARIVEGQIAPGTAVDRFRRALDECLIREVWRQFPSLAQFSGVSYDHEVAEFRRLDEQRIDVARLEVRMRHHVELHLAKLSHDHQHEFRTINRQIAKKRNHMALRELFARAPNAVQKLKPVFMMSPLSVAQFLKPGKITFDLLIVDEASQVRPEEALGAIARVRQIVVVGDDKQLPPTNFFNQILVDDDDEVDATGVGGLESILGLCTAQNISRRMLRWHYRSRHDSLIRVSNHEFYDDALLVAPSPADDPNKGLRFHHIANGVFDRGGSATNRIEAEAVARAVIEHARSFPQLSLGVGTFSIAQRDAILDALELLRRKEPSFEDFFALGNREPFFVKNLENVQGDERDVIFISVGYGKDSSGYFALGFGPVSNPGGERRLNVLMTRARDCCRVFSSITADDIDLNRAKSRGAEVLKVFLSYAADRRLDVPKPSGGDHDSEFERQVARAVRTLGFEVHAQVGSAGFLIDLAVVDPEMPGRYLLGIECDGATYHRARWARDRDRLRQQVLEDQGWTIHRVWSTDWFRQPTEQLRRIASAIERARARLGMRMEESTITGAIENAAGAAGDEATRPNNVPSPNEGRDRAAATPNPPLSPEKTAVLAALDRRARNARRKEAIGPVILSMDTKIEQQQLEPILCELVEEGLVTRFGSGRSARYQRT